MTEAPEHQAPKGLEVGLDVVAGWIRESDEITEPLTAQRIGNGQSNLTYLLTDAADRRWVLRRPPLGHLLQSAHDVAREYRIMSALQGTGVPVPRVLGLWTPNDVAHMVMGFLDGYVIDSAAKGEAASPELRAAIGPSIARTLARIHAVPLEEVGLLDLASHKPYAQRQLSRWVRQLEASRTTESADLDRVTEILQASVVPQSDLTLVHGDLHLANAISDPETGEVIGALDWELSTLGDPLADLGTLLAYWPEPSDGLAPGIFGASALPGFSSRAELVDAYAQASGRDVADVGFWHVLGVWKVVAIIEGVRRRVLDEPGNASLGGVPTEEMVHGLSGRALTLAKEYGLPGA